MMDERSNVLSAALATMGAVIADFYSHLAWWLLLAAVLVLTDLRFGMKAAARRGEKIRISRAWRRTINKMVDYLCWVTLAEVCSRTFGITLGAPIVSMGVLLIIYGIEISSCFNNYFEYKGIQKKFNFWKLINRPDISGALEDTCGVIKSKQNDTEPDTD